MRALVQNLLQVSLSSVREQTDRRVSHRHIFQLVSLADDGFPSFVELIDPVLQFLLFLLLMLALSLCCLLRLLVLRLLLLDFVTLHASQLLLQVLRLELVEFLGFVQHPLLDEFERQYVPFSNVASHSKAVAFQASRF